MNELIGTRIEALISSLGLKKVRFADALSIDQSYVTQLINGRRSPSDRLVADICRTYNVNETWLRTGTGEMFTPISKDEEFDMLCAEIQMSGDEFIKDIVRKYWSLGEDEKAIVRQMLSGISNI